jgi:hypothetical protein
MKHTPGLAATGAALFLTTALLCVTSAGLAQSTKKPAGHKPPAKAKATSEVKYKAHCGMIYSAADAKKYHYICPMDHKPLIKIASARPGQKAK